MNIALFGYGRMGKEIALVAKERGHAIVYINNGEPIEWDQLDRADVAIEFSQPDAAWSNISALLSHRIPVVCGTTGWLARKSEADALAEKEQVGFLYASNFSLAVNLFFSMNEHFARLMAPYKQFVPAVHEIHHTGKKDAPSGTAITTAEGILAAQEQLSGWSMSAEPNTLHITADRIDPYFGKHTVTYASTQDVLSLSHEALSRKGFAEGAVIGAEWLVGKRGSFSMRDVLNLS